LLEEYSKGLKMKKIIKSIVLPIIPKKLIRLKGKIFPKVGTVNEGNSQALDIYWDPNMAAVLETWGVGNAWNEIQLLMMNAHGNVLDIACGTGKVMTLLQEMKDIKVTGCDISDFLLGKAAERGIERDRLVCCDATKLPYSANHFDYAYSIGSLEHFTEEGIHDLMEQCKKVVSKRSFHMIPVSRSNKDEGWISPWQSYFNNSTQWWVERCERVFNKVTVLDSAWSDDRSVGKWLVCED